VRVLVTHDPVDAALLADHMVVLDHGRVAQTGTPAEITARPRNRWVSQLVGVNLFTGDAGPGGIVELDGGGTLVLADTTHRGRVFAVVHPRAVTLHHDRPEGSARNTWPGRVDAVEPLGDRLRVRVDGRPPVVAETTEGGGRHVGLGHGAPVWISVKATEIDVYPA
jgi:molybdate transport system ATP-binding protein